MDGMTKVYSLLDQLAEAIAERFPKATDTRISLADDGYVNIDVCQTKRIEDLPCEAWKRRVLLDQCKLPGHDWSADRSSEQNSYYETQKRLLKEG